jgi:hypothetical protein
MVAQTSLDERMKAQCSGLLQEIQQASDIVGLIESEYVADRLREAKHARRSHRNHSRRPTDGVGLSRRLAMISPVPVKASKSRRPLV